MCIAYLWGWSTWYLLGVPNTLFFCDTRMICWKIMSRSISEEAFSELHLKSVAQPHGSMDRDKMFLLDTPMSPSGLFCESINMVISRFQEAKTHTEASKKFLPHGTHGSGLSAPQPQPRPTPLRQKSQKQSMVSRAPLHRDWGEAHHFQ